MTMIDPNELNVSGPASPRREHGQDGETIRTPRPYGDIDNLLDEIPRVREDDPPMRRWWIDDDSGEDQPER